MNNNMQVIKRDLTLEDVSFDKVLRRLKHLSGDLEINVYEITQQVCLRIHDKINTYELDELAASFCSSLSIDHPDYGKLASRITISNHHKKTSPSFSETISLLYWNKIEDDEHVALVSKKLYDITMKNKEKLNSYIDYTRDNLFDYFGFKTLEKSYLIKINDNVIERPQHLFMRVALGIHEEDIKDALETYDLLSLKMAIHATPTLFNAGTTRNQCSSCYLVGIKDSIKGIYDCLQDCALISKYAGGIGVHIHNIRAKGSRIRGTNGIATGIVPMLRVFNNTARYVDQGSKRFGSIAMYLEPWHADIFSFLELRKNHGNEEDRCRDLFTALWVPDLFMKRVEDNGIWSLICPDKCPGLCDTYGEEFEELYVNYEKEGKFVKQIKAQDLWFAILQTQIEQGVPYMLYKDACNKKSNQKNIGIIRSSNLCVAPETMILTEDGYFKIKDLENKEVNVWNGEEFSKTTVMKTGVNQKLINVEFSNGMDIDCTPYHKFYIETASRPNDKSEPKIIDAKDLKEDMKIVKFELPIIKNYTKELNDAYTHGLFCADGTYSKSDKEIKQCDYKKYNDTEFCKRHQDYEKKYESDDKCRAECYGDHPVIFLYGEKMKLLEYINYRYYNENKSSNRLDVAINLDIETKYNVPIDYTIDSKLRWLEGYIDGDGCLTKNGDAIGIQISSVNLEFIKNISYMLNTLGVSCPIAIMHKERIESLPTHKNGEYKKYNCKQIYRLVINNYSLYKLYELGFNPNRLDISSIKEPKFRTRYIKIKSVKDNDRYDDTYCFSETKKHKGIFNGILLGNCSEIIQYSDANETSVCNLASMCLPSYIEDGVFNFEKLHKNVKVVTKNINKIIDNNFYPTSKTKLSNLKHRPMGIGVQGLADTFMILRLPFESDEAKELNKKIFATIYHAALEYSTELAKKRHEMPVAELYNSLNEYEKEVINTKYPGSYLTFEGSPASQGLLQFDLWDKEPDSMYDWDTLKQSILTYGLRNSLFVALMPTASTSNLMGFNEAFEPITNNIYKRRVLSGEFIMINKYLINDLISMKLWNKDMKEKIMINNGSIQNIEEIPSELKELYKISWEMKQKNIIDMALDRSIYVCQSQSLNIFMEEPDFKKLTSMHFYSWSNGSKISNYYIRTRARVQTQKFTIDPLKEKEILNKNKKPIIECNDEVCLVCSS